RWHQPGRRDKHRQYRHVRWELVGLVAGNERRRRLQPGHPICALPRHVHHLKPRPHAGPERHHAGMELMEKTPKGLLEASARKPFMQGWQISWIVRLSFYRRECNMSRCCGSE